MRSAAIFPRSIVRRSEDIYINQYEIITLSQVPREQCASVPRQLCQSVPVETCQPVERQNCTQVPRKQCQPSTLEHCEPITKAGIYSIHQFFFQGWGGWWYNFARWIKLSIAASLRDYPGQDMWDSTEGEMFTEMWECLLVQGLPLETSWSHDDLSRHS